MNSNVKQKEGKKKTQTKTSLLVHPKGHLENMIRKENLQIINVLKIAHSC